MLGSWRGALGLRLYRMIHPALPGAPAAGSGHGTDTAGAPPGRLIWLHAPDAARLGGLSALGARLREAGLADQILLTCAEAGAGDAQPVPADTPGAVAAFLDHWRPALCLWAGGGLRPVLLHQAAARHLPVVLLDGTDPALPRPGLWSRLMPGLYGAMRALLMRDEAGLRAFRRAGAPGRLLSVAGPMEERSHALPVPEAERLALSRLIGTRPVWLAVGVPEAEEADVIRAHEEALRHTHRLLLILVPADPARIPHLLRELPAQHRLEVGYRAADEDPDEETQVYLADDDEPGLWYQLAPVTWAGGTLKGEGAMRHPFEAAAAGSALLHGPRGGRFATDFDRLREAGGSRLVSQGAALGEAVSDLLAADRCARLSQAAWGVTSAGSEVSDQILTLVKEILSEERPAA